MGKSKATGGLMWLIWTGKGRVRLFLFSWRALYKTLKCWHLNKNVSLPDDRLFFFTHQHSRGTLAHARPQLGHCKRQIPKMILIPFSPVLFFLLNNKSHFIERQLPTLRQLCCQVQICFEHVAGSLYASGLPPPSFSFCCWKFGTRTRISVPLLLIPYRKEVIK